jgi:2-iminobutanoate/2-iminopropanoate deaminase
VLANITAILRDCGAAITDVAKTTVFVTDIAEFPTVNAAYAEAFGDHRPARSTVQVAALPGGALVEIETWVYAPVPA